MRATFMLCASVVALAGAAPAHAQWHGRPSALYDVSCDRECLLGHAEGYMQAMMAKDPGLLPLSPDVILTENNVVLPVGDGVWRTIDAVRGGPMTAADIQTGNAAWFGIIEENGVPAYYAMRMQVEHGLITQIEQVVTRQPEPPKPFGDPDTVERTLEWNDILPIEERRPRERLRSVADGYFETVELNDGQLFTHFTPDCGRLENGVATSGTGDRACELQLGQGIFYINKRIRERRFPLIDVDRGIVVSTGFFDHANTFSEYQTNDGQTRRTLLKWPNSISLLEAFKVEDSQIRLIDAVFTYVPYFMHNPFAEVPNMPEPVGERAGPGDCDEACMSDLAQRYMNSLLAQDYTDGLPADGPGLPFAGTGEPTDRSSGLPWAERVRFTEQNVPIMIGDGQWGSVRAVREPILTMADDRTGNAIWFGIIEDHGQPAYYAMSLTVENGRIADVETLAGRRENPGPFADADAYRIGAAFNAPLPADARTRRGRMVDLVEDYYEAIEEGGAPERFTEDCVIVNNGETFAQGETRSCADLFATEAWYAVERARDVRIMAVDEERGLVAAIAMLDRPMDAPRDGEEILYPYTTGVLDIFRIEDGRIARVEGVSAFLTYGMPAPLGGN